MRLTDNLKRWLVENKSVAEDADDTAYRKAAAEALCDESLTNEEFIAMTKDPDADKASTLQTLLESIAKSQQEMQEFAATLAKQQAATKIEEPQPKMAKPQSGVTDRTIAGGDGSQDGDVTVKHITADQRYSQNKATKYFPQTNSRGLPHPHAGRRFAEGGTHGYRYIDEQSELDRAVCGAFAKWMLFREPVAKGLIPRSVITEHDNELVQYSMRNMNWSGVITRFGENDESGTAVNNRRLTDMEVKTLLDDATSGGIYAVPTVFDDAIITTPLLNGEFYPRVNVVNIPRGRVVEGASMGNPTLTWGATEAVAITLETTTSFVSNFDTNIHVVTGAIAIGLDFLSDTPINFGDLITQRYGEQLLATLDTQIVGGDGTNEPTGIHDQGTNVAFSGVWTAERLLTLMMTVGKQYKAGYDNNRICWGADPTTYADVRAIYTGVTSDTRFVFGDDVNSYMVLGHPFLINAEYAAAEMNFVNLARYRMYRRLGLTARLETGGQTLAVANSALLIARARFGGQLESTSACAYTADGAA